MEKAIHHARLIRFATFEVDLQAGEVHKNGLKLKLSGQPFQVLAILLERPGAVVTREELQKRLWPDTFVDVDHNLNTAINKIREVLGDSAENPRFVETLPRRGYRFVAPVTGDGQKKQKITLATRTVALLGAVAILLGVTAVGGWFWGASRGRVLTEKDTIVLGDFANSTGDSVFDGTLREGLSVQLEQSPFLSLVSEEGIHQTLRMMGQPANARLTPEVSREVCIRTSSTTALEGSIALIGTRYNLVLKAVNCASGDLLASTEAWANDKSHVLDVLSEMASEMRGKLGESLSTVQKYNTPLLQATTPSLEALQAYNLGWQAMVELDEPSALPFFQRAIRLDANFAIAHWAMGRVYSYIGESTLATQNSRKAFDLRAGTSELEKLIIEADYHSTVSGDLVMLRRACELGSKTYPREPIFHGDLGMLSYYLGQYNAGLKEHLDALRLDPYQVSFRQVVFGYLLLNLPDKAETLSAEAHAKGLDSDLPDVRYEIAFYRDDAGEMERQASDAVKRPEYEDLLLALQADTAAYFGHLEKASEFSRKAVDSAEHAGKRETAAGYVAVAGLREALLGDAAQARQAAVKARQRATGRDMDYAIALTFAYAEGNNEAQIAANSLGKRFPEDTIAQFNYLPTIRAKLALNRSQPHEALSILDAATPYDLGWVSDSNYNWPNLYPIYVRGEAYLAADRGREAAAEFQTILDHRGIVLNEPIGALAHLQQGRAYALQGATAKARAAYQDFLTLWKDADPDIPILIQAKAEYSKLQ